MSKTSKSKANTDAAAYTIQINDPERRAKIVAVFEQRGYGELSVSAMCRKLIDEWLVAQAKA